MKKVLLKNENKPPFRGVGGQNQRKHGVWVAEQRNKVGQRGKTKENTGFGWPNKEIKGILGQKTKQLNGWG
jgi:hypothetical protein